MFPKRIVVVIVVLVIGRFLGGGPASAQVERNGEPNPSEVEEARAAREQMLARWSRLRAFEHVAGRERELERLSAPLFTFSESTRETGHLGTLWAWGPKGRPAALVSQNKAYRERVWGFELVALVEDVTVVMHDGWRWTPGSAVNMIRFENAPPAADTDSKRLLQMRSLARRFKVSEDYFNESFELRLLPQPVHRYQDPAADLIDGALFIYAHGTNPEAIALIECRRETAQPMWSYGFLPLAGAGVSAKLDGKTVWTKLPTRESKAQELYSTWLETEEP
jgi:hypothetical protein